MKQKLIVILVDHKWRDLPGYAYLKYLIEKKYNHRVLLIEKGQAYRLIPLKILPDMVLFIHLLSPTLFPYIKYLKDLGITIGILPTEGMPQIRPDLLAGKDSDYSLADFHFVWSQIMKDLMIKYKTMPEDKIFVCGSPRFDFYSEPAYKCVMKREDFAKKYNLDPSKKAVLFITNYVRAALIADEVRKEFFLKETKLNERGDDLSAKPLEYARMDLESRTLFLDSFKKFCSTHRDLNIVIKPHPAEDVGFYQELIKEVNNPNVRLIYQEYIWDVLNFMDVYVGRTCTTGVEAWFLNKPTITFHLYPNEYYYSDLQAKGSALVESYEDLIKTVEYYLAGNPVSEEIKKGRREYLKDWVYKPDGHACERYAEVLDTLLKEKKDSPRKWYLHPLKLLKSRELLAHAAKKFLPAKKDGPSLKADPNTKLNILGHYDKYITQEDVDSWDKKIKSCLG